MLHPTPYTLHPTSSRASRVGQSLIEAVIAITVLTTGFLGISTLLARSYVLTRVVSDQLTANYLASEGVEIAKNLIDHDVYESLPVSDGGGGNPNYAWGECFSPPENDVELDYTTTDCRSMPVFSLPGQFLYFDPVTHLYGYASDLDPAHDPVPTAFTREISVSENGTEITVNSIVRWSSGDVTDQEINLEDHFYEWQP